MNVYRLKLPLWLAAGLFGASAVAAALWAVFWPVEAGAPELLASASGRAVAEESPEIRRPLEDYAVIWQREVRAKLYEQTVITPPAPPPPRPKLDLKLAGTMVEPGFTCATFIDAAGKTHLKRAGETIAGARVKSISDGSVTVIFAGTELTLKVERKAAP